MHAWLVPAIILGLAVGLGLVALGGWLGTTMKTRSGSWREREPMSSTRSASDAARQRAAQSSISHEDLLHAAQVESLGMLAGGIAHDFNNLLTGILGNTNLALAELPPGPAREAVLEADMAAKRARELVAQILAYSGRGRLELRPIDLATLSRETVTLLHHVLSPKAKVQIEAFDVASIEADPAQIRQVVMNLLTNASDALGNAPGDVFVRVIRERMSREQLDRTMLGRELPVGRYVRVEVRDTGCGMDNETRQRMFEPYFTTKFTGRGLGLAALLGIVRHHSGTLAVQSVPGEGTTVTVWFPASEADVLPSDTPEPARSTLPGRSAARTGTILLAEDEEMVRRVTTRMLSKLGYEVIAVSDGEEALRTIREERNTFTLALVDVRMPGIDGREVLRFLRDQRPELPVILMTGYAGPDGASDAIAPNAWLRKPFSLRDLLQALDGVCTRT